MSSISARPRRTRRPRAARAPASRRAPAAPAARASGSAGAPSKRSRGDRARAVEAVARLAAQARRAALDERQAAARDADHEHVRAARLRHEAFAPLRRPPATLRVQVAGQPAVAALAERQRVPIASPDASAGSQALRCASLPRAPIASPASVCPRNGLGSAPRAERLRRRAPARGARDPRRRAPRARARPRSRARRAPSTAPGSWPAPASKSSRSRGAGTRP